MKKQEVFFNLNKQDLQHFIRQLERLRPGETFSRSNIEGTVKIKLREKGEIKND